MWHNIALKVKFFVPYTKLAAPTVQSIYENGAGKNRLFEESIVLKTETNFKR